MSPKYDNMLLFNKLQKENNPYGQYNTKRTFWLQCKKHLNNFLIHFDSNVSVENYKELDDFEKDEVMESVNQLIRDIK